MRGLDIPVSSLKRCSDTLLANTSLRLVDAKAELRHSMAIVEGKLGLERKLLGGHDEV